MARVIAAVKVEGDELATPTVPMRDRSLGLERQIVGEPGAGTTRTVLNSGPQAVEWATFDGVGTLSGYTSVAALATTTVSTLPKKFRCLGGRARLIVTDTP